MNRIEEMLKRGFGLVTINDLISLRLHDDLLTVHFETLPGYINGWTVPIESRTLDGIKEEAGDYLNQYIITYQVGVVADLANM